MGLSDHLVLVFDYVYRAQRASDAVKLLQKTNLNTLMSDLQGLTTTLVQDMDVNLYRANLTDTLQRMIAANCYYVEKQSEKELLHNK